MTFAIGTRDGQVSDLTGENGVRNQIPRRALIFLLTPRRSRTPTIHSAARSTSCAAASRRWVIDRSNRRVGPASVSVRPNGQRQREALDCHAFTSNQREECAQMPEKMARSVPEHRSGCPIHWWPSSPRGCLAGRPRIRKNTPQFGSHPGNPGLEAGAGVSAWTVALRNASRARRLQTGRWKATGQLKQCGIPPTSI